MQSRFTIIKSEHMGMCFGVRDAIALAEEKAREGSVTLLGQLVHNPHVMKQLEQRGVRVMASEREAGHGAVMITAHGVSDRRREELNRTGRVVWDATCPLVHYAHRSVRLLERQGYFPVIVGQAGHVEVKGLTGDLGEHRVILTREEVEGLPIRTRYGFASQTTQPVRKLKELSEHCRECFPQADVRMVDTVCQPTKQRQSAAADLARRSDVVLVVGGAGSNNTHHLAATCARHCSAVHLITDPNDLMEEWIGTARVVGVTAGTSAPDFVVEKVIRRLEDLGGRLTSVGIE